MTQPLEDGLPKDRANAVKTAWYVYKNAPMAARFHTLVRALTCPLGALLPFFPRQGKVLDLGCGHGLLVHLLATNPAFSGLELYGVDHDAAKIRIAQRTARPGVLFSASPISALPVAGLDAIAIVDVLYTVNIDKWRHILGDCFRMMRHGALLLVKEVIDQPHWKHNAILAQERLAVTVFGITKGDRPHFESAHTYRSALSQSGFVVIEERALGQRSWISHYLFVAQKPPVAAVPQ